MDSLMDLIEISFKDLAMKVILRWRTIIAVAIAFACLLGGFPVVKDMQSVPLNEADKEELYESQVEGYRSTLTPNEFEEVELQVSSYNTLFASYEKNKEYTEKSIYYNLDYTSVPSIVETYVLNIYSEENLLQSGCINIADAVSQIICDEEFSNDISEVYGISPNYAEEMILFGNSVRNNVSDAGTQTDSNNRLLQVEILGRNEEECNLIKELVDSKMKTIASELDGIYGKCELTLVKSVYGERYRKSLLKDQKKILENQNLIMSDMTRLPIGLSDVQKELFELLIANAPMEDGDIVHEMQEVDASSGISVKGFLKYFIIGGVAGAFLAAVFFAARYLLSNKLHTREDIVSMFRIPVFETLTIEKNRKNGIDRFIMRCFGYDISGRSNEEKIDIIVSNILMIARKQSLESVFITGIYNDAQVKPIEETICSLLKSRGIKACIGGNILGDTDALKKMAESSAVVIVETIGKSAYADMIREIDCCQRQEIPVLGCVVIE